MHIWSLIIYRVFRRMLRQPGFLLSSGTFLAVGLAAATAFLALVNTVLLAPLPFRDPDSLFAIRSLNTQDGEDTDVLSLADFGDLQQQLSDGSVFSAATAFRGDFVTYTPRGGTAQQWIGARITSQFFEVFELPPLHGRLLQASDFESGAAPVVMISEQIWESVFSGDPSIIGSTVEMNGQPFEVVGIVPGRVHEPVWAETWLPLPNDSPEYFSRDGRYMRAVGRLAPGVSPAAASSQLRAFSEVLGQAHPGTNRNWVLHMMPLLEMRVEGIRQSLLLGMVAAALLLLITALSLANLLLARGARRQTEHALQRALGANGRHLAADVALEAFAIALWGALLASCLLWFGFSKLLPAIPWELIPRANEIHFGWKTLLQLFSITLLTALLSSLWPVIQTRRANLQSLLNQSGGKHSLRSGKQLRTGLLMIQVALSLAILASATAVAQQFKQLLNTPLGFQIDGIHTFMISPDQSQIRDWYDFSLTYDRLLDEVRAIPEVSEVAWTTIPPLFGSSIQFSFEMETNTLDNERAVEATIQSVSAGVFDFLGLELIDGRLLRDSDVRQSPNVAIINSELAERFFPDRNPIGQRIRVLSWINDGWKEIVGVVSTNVQDQLNETPIAQVYFPYQQTPWIFGNLMVKGSGSGLVHQVDSAIRRVDPNIAPTHSTIEEFQNRQTTRDRAITTIMGAFGIAAAGLAAFGIFALTALDVAEQRKDIGIRMALGADRSSIRKHYLCKGLKTTTIGLLLGIGFAVITDKLIAGLLGPSESTQLLFLLSACIALLTVCSLAVLIPANRASRLDPNICLRIQ